ncbi:hypothetical protein [Streptomyces chartreusis]
MPITVGERAPARIGRSAEGAAADTGRTAEAHLLNGGPPGAPIP